MKKILALLLVVCTMICAMTVCASAVDDVTIKFRPGDEGDSAFIIENNAHKNATQYFTDTGCHVTIKFTGDFAAAKKVYFQAGVWGRLNLAVSTDNRSWTDLMMAEDTLGSQTIKIDLTDKIDRSKGEVYIRIGHSSFTYDAEGNSTIKEGKPDGNGGSLLFREDALLILKNNDNTTVVPVFGFDSDVTGAPANTEKHLDGEACVLYTFGAEDNTKVIYKAFDPVDVSKCNVVELYMYVSEAALFDSIGGGQLELTSSGECDKEETSWNTESLKTFVVGGVKDGWNLLRLPIGGSATDWSKLNYMRIYIPGCDASKEGKQIGFDMLVGLGEDAASPVPSTQKPADPQPQDPQPQDPTPATFDAASSVAVAAVCALGVALVASKKRH